MTDNNSNAALVMIPGPIEFTNEVLKAVGSHTYSHVDPDFIRIFSNVIKQLRRVFVSESAQPFVVSGSGTLGWDMIAANLTEPNDHVLVISAGYFGDEFSNCLSTYNNTKVTVLQPPTIGDLATLSQIESAIKSSPTPFRLVTITHVDTSTGVKSNLKAISDLVHQLSPSTFIIADCVCATGAEELLMDAWHIDSVITASQKALGTPPGLSIVIASSRAIEFATKQRKTPVANYYVNWNRWLPIMQAYENLQAAYFTTPAVNLICGLEVSLTQIIGSQSIHDVWRKHESCAKAIKEALKEIGLKTLPVKEEFESNALTTVWLPEGISGDELRKEMKKQGVVVAGGLYKDWKTKYFRIGHMGKSIMGDAGKDVEKNTGSLGRKFDSVWLFQVY